MKAYGKDARIGFIGLGVMGAGMARRLLDAGYALALHNRTASRAGAFAGLGARIADSPADAAAGCDILFLSLPETDDVEQVLFGPGGAAQSLRSGACVFDTSTISATGARVIAGRLSTQGVHFLDAPVSGGKHAAEQGTLTCMVGGPEPVFEACREIASAIAARYIRIGGHGAGQIAKACNQVAVVNAMLGVAEALALAAKQGVDPGIVREALLGGAAKSFSLENHGKRILERNFTPGFTAALMRKDLGLAAQAGHDAGAFLPGTHLILQLLESLCATGSGNKDWSALGDLVGRMSGISQEKI